MPNKIEDLDKHINERYIETIEYYWTASKNNKKWYKWTRSLTIIFGALVTLIASLSSSKMLPENSVVGIFFTFGTPALAACLTIIAGFSQSFQWGSTWQNMVLTAQHVQKEYDKFLVTDPANRDYLREAEKLNEFIISESRGFFERMLGGGAPPKQVDIETATN